MAERVGYRCSNPTCRRLTSRPHPTDAAEVIRAGVAAHITAASSGGARYDASLSPQQRSSIENGIWLCEVCAKEIDDAADLYTKELLRHWKQNAERSAAVAARAGPDVIAEVQAAIDLARGTLIEFAAHWQANEPLYDLPRSTMTDAEWEEENRVIIQYGISRLAAFGTEVAPLITAALTKATAVLGESDPLIKDLMREAKGGVSVNYISMRLLAHSLQKLRTILDLR
jgi:hypothetical protein